MKLSSNSDSKSYSNSNSNFFPNPNNIQYNTNKSYKTSPNYNTNTKTNISLILLTFQILLLITTSKCNSLILSNPSCDKTTIGNLELITSNLSSKRIDSSHRLQMIVIVDSYYMKIINNYDLNNRIQFRKEYPMKDLKKINKVPLNRSTDCENRKMCFEVLFKTAISKRDVVTFCINNKVKNKDMNNYGNNYNNNYRFNNKGINYQMSKEKWFAKISNAKRCNQSIYLEKNKIINQIENYEEIINNKIEINVPMEVKELSKIDEMLKKEEKANKCCKDEAVNEKANGKIMKVKSISNERVIVNPYFNLNSSGVDYIKGGSKFYSSSNSKVSSKISASSNKNKATKAIRAVRSIKKKRKMKIIKSVKIDNKEITNY